MAKRDQVTVKDWRRHRRQQLKRYVSLGWILIAKGHEWENW